MADRATARAQDGEEKGPRSNTKRVPLSFRTASVVRTSAAIRISASKRAAKRLFVRAGTAGVQLP